jgi:hypothetical protein
MQPSRGRASGEEAAIDDGTLRRLDLLRELAARPGTEAEGLAAEAAITRIMQRHGLTGGGRCFGDFWRGYRPECGAHVTKLSITCTAFKRIDKNTLVGFATICIAEMHLTIKDVTVHQKGDSRWAALPARPQLDRDGAAIKKEGKVQYFNLMEFDDRPTRDAFSAAVIAAVLEHEPGAFS